MKVQVIFKYHTVINNSGDSKLRLKRSLYLVRWIWCAGTLQHLLPTVLGTTVKYTCKKILSLRPWIYSTTFTFLYLERVEAGGSPAVGAQITSVVLRLIVFTKLNLESGLLDRETVLCTEA